MGGERPRLHIAMTTQRQLHGDLGAVSTCANDVLHTGARTAKVRTHDANGEDFTRQRAPIRAIASAKLWSTSAITSARLWSTSTIARLWSTSAITIDSARFSTFCLLPLSSARLVSVVLHKFEEGVDAAVVRAASCSRGHGSGAKLCSSGAWCGTQPCHEGM